MTSTFPAGEYDPEGMMEARKRIDSGEQIGPRTYNSGRYFGTARRGWNPNATTADIYRDVDAWAAKGARAFKAKSIAPEHLKALVERAHQHGLTVTAHLESGFRNKAILFQEIVQPGGLAGSQPLRSLSIVPITGFGDEPFLV